MTDGAQDMGGVKGFGPVEPEPNEPVFHREWERRAFALTLAMGKPGGWNLDMSRSARENRPNNEYLSMSYYQIWLAGLETLMKEGNLISEDEIEAQQSLYPPKSLPVLSSADVEKTLHQRGPTERIVRAPARFKPGDRVRMRTINPPTHTRLPRYVCGHTAVVERVIGYHVFPDSNAIDKGEDPQWLYTVVFDGRELWGPAAQAGTKVSIDAWEPYMETI